MKTSQVLLAALAAVLFANAVCAQSGTEPTAFGGANPMHGDLSASAVAAAAVSHLPYLCLACMRDPAPCLTT